MFTRKRKVGARRFTPRKRQRRVIGFEQPRQRRRRRATIGMVHDAELKFIDSDKDSTTVAGTGEITTSLNLIVQGITEVTRLGRKVVVKSIGLHIALDLGAVIDQSDIPSGDILRVMCFQDKQCNGANAAVLDILETTTWNSFRNLTNSKRFRILMDTHYAINRRVAMTDGTNTSQSPVVVLNLKKRFFNLNVPLEFTAETGAIGELTTNNFALLYISKNGVVNVQTHVRVRFIG